MSRRIGAYAVWTPSGLDEFVDETILRVTDLTPVMTEIATLSVNEVDERLARGGDGDWQALAPATLKRWGPHPIGNNRHGGFAPSIGAVVGPKFAGWRTKAPHAHFLARGTAQYRSAGGARSYRYQSKTGGRKGRAAQRAHRLNSTILSSQHEPARPFDYLSDALEELAGDMVVDFVIGEAAQ